MDSRIFTRCVRVQPGYSLNPLPSAVSTVIPPSRVVSVRTTHDVSTALHSSCTASQGENRCTTHLGTLVLSGLQWAGQYQVTAVGDSSGGWRSQNPHQLTTRHDISSVQPFTSLVRNVQHNFMTASREPMEHRLARSRQRHPRRFSESNPVPTSPVT